MQASEKPAQEEKSNAPHLKFYTYLTGNKKPKPLIEVTCGIVLEDGEHDRLCCWLPTGKQGCQNFRSDPSALTLRDDKELL
jgi:hypothetical protein